MVESVSVAAVNPRFARAQAGCQESLNALLRQHEGLVQAAVRRQVTGSTAPIYCMDRYKATCSSLICIPS